MATYKNWDDLIKGLQKSVDKSLKTKVAPTVKKKLQKNAESMAVGEWSRGSGGGGISDPKNIVSEVEDGELLVKDVAPPQDPIWGDYDDSDPTIFSRWIDQGEWMELNEFISTGKKTKRPAREFVTKTQNEVNASSSEIVKILKDGMGIK